MTSDRVRFPKPLEQYKVLSFFGSNIVITEDEEWKRQRKITAPAFSEVCGEDSLKSAMSCADDSNIRETTDLSGMRHRR